MSKALHVVDSQVQQHLLFEVITEGIHVGGIVPSDSKDLTFHQFCMVHKSLHFCLTLCSIPDYSRISLNASAIFRHECN